MKCVTYVRLDGSVEPEKRFDIVKAFNSDPTIDVLLLTTHGVNFFSISTSQFVEIYVGVGASRVRALYQEAKENAPSVVFIDELDAVGRERGLIKGSGGQERDATLNQLLYLSSVFFYLFLCLVHARKKPMAEDVDYMAFASMTDGMVGAELANIIEIAAINMMRDGRTEGKLTDGSVFDSRFERGDPIEFELGSGQVIKGWDQGLLGMCIGEKRKLKIPAKLGYGEQRSPPTIPDAQIGVCYGTNGDNLPSRQDVVALYNQNDQQALQALGGSNIELILGILNPKLQTLASSQAEADTWVQNNVKNFGNMTQFLVPAMQNVHTAIVNAGLGIQIKVSTAISTGLLGNPFPPSQGSFRPKIRPSFIDPIISFLVTNGKRWHFGDCCVREWLAYYGGTDMTVDNAKIYNNNLIQHVKGGTPKKPGKAIETYIFAMFDENQKTGDEVKRHWGLFSPDKQLKYPVTFN
ncbi:hypothetical protein LOK49_LG05G02151 [Camellia lanceoleosa]|uniref:Uncharacterized protein n=1 Tax=Camellia lanceoleosa TaxID=1840588 RepID=A0ACC0HN52_9ERIC|nr:hypothetical protein LOK49_LG05G02151 [Camellia lanceoleosa]